MSAENTENREVETTVQVNQRPGRKQGSTNLRIRLEHAERLKEKEERLRAEGVRKSLRIEQKREQALNITSENENLPKNYEEAMQSRDRKQWENAMEEELKSMKTRQVWNLIDRKKATKVIKSKWVYSIKRDEDGKRRYNARLVAVGCQQRIEENVFMEQPPGFDSDKSKECNIAKTPMDIQQNLNEHKNSLEVDRTSFQEMLGSLMYLSVSTRPDITFGVSYLSQFSNNPKQIHLTALNRIYRYLKGTREYKLSYSRASGNLNVSTDASWITTADAKSYSGYIAKIGDNVISWKSKKQNLVALSTCEAELMAICEGAQELTCNSLGDKSIVKPPIELKTDSRAAMDWINRDKITSRTKHINRKYYFIKDEVKNRNIDLIHVASEEMEADLLTKALSEVKINRGIQRVNLER